MYHTMTQNALTSKIQFNTLTLTVVIISKYNAVYSFPVNGVSM